MVYGKNRIPYWIDRRLTGLARPDYHAVVSFGLPFEPEDCPIWEILGKMTGAGQGIILIFMGCRGGHRRQAGRLAQPAGEDGGRLGGRTPTVGLDSNLLDGSRNHHYRRPQYQRAI